LNKGTENNFVLFSFYFSDIYFIIYSCLKENNYFKLKMAYNDGNSAGEGGSGSVWSSGSHGGKFNQIVYIK
jgi:hypothetical protein